ncbi:MAG: TrkH family potassium uptake protein [Muribaculaceae bacterium]|nr:TrkH family potassium uptake protein [Muribaculaceae bacterium]MDE6532021.1 TrkH family potassium uptake protein [Muribaculaceae bacterium]
MKTTLRIRSIIRIMGRLVLIEAALMLLPLAVCVIYGEEDWKVFAMSSAVTGIAGLVAEISTRGTPMSLPGREGFILTALVWWVFGLFGMIPFMTGSCSLDFTDAMFEVISGFTTTGASMITDVEAQSHGILFWRAFTQWIGGLGIVFFMLAVLPELNRGAGISMYNAEATGITHDKLHPRIHQTALSVWGVYVCLTVLSVVLLWCGPMNFFDSVCQTFAAVSTGGFSTRNEGVGYWDSDYVYLVLIFVMFVAGVNFMLLYNAWKRGWRELFCNDVLKAYSRVVGLAFIVFLVAALVRGVSEGIGRIVVYPLFHIVSAVTSTGFSISEAETWGPVSLLMTLLLMLCGACAGSTTGGIKVDRVVVLWRNFMNEIKKTVFPKRVYVVSLNGTSLYNSLVGRISAFVTLYMLAIGVSALIVAMYGYSLTDSVFMVISGMGCNGLGYGATGVEGSYAFLPDGVKWLLVVDMLMGRLELFTFMVLLLPGFWRR